MPMSMPHDATQPGQVQDQGHGRVEMREPAVGLDVVSAKALGCVLQPSQLPIPIPSSSPLSVAAPLAQTQDSKTPTPPQTQFQSQTPTSTPTHTRSSSPRLGSAQSHAQSHPHPHPHPLSPAHNLPAFKPTLIILTWICLSTAVIFYNARILKDWGFPYPVMLTTLHLAFQTAATQLLARTTSLVPPPPSAYSLLPTSTGSSPGTNPRDKFISSPPRSPSHPSSPAPTPLPTLPLGLFFKRVVPIGVLFSLSLVLSNAVYLYLSVAFIQMIKAASPVAVLLTSFAFGLHPPSLRLFGIVLLISLGIGLASYGELAFSLAGFLMQVLAIIVEANRVVLIQLLLGTGMAPLTSLYFFAPVCLVINAALVLPLEGTAPLLALSRLGPAVILSNALLTFLLNVAAVYLIQLSSLVLSLSKVVKDLVLIIGSGVVFGTKPVSPVQWIGYFLALVGLGAYKRGT